MIQHYVARASDSAPAVTFTSGASTVLFWGLHLGDLAVIVSMLATVAGLALQFYVAFRRISSLERGQAVSLVATAAVATAARAQAVKSADNAARLDAVEEKAATDS